MVAVLLAAALTAAQPAGVPLQIVAEPLGQGVPSPADLAGWAQDAFAGTSLVAMPFDATENVARARSGKAPGECGYDVACLARAGRLVGARFVLAVGLSKLGTSWLFNFLIVDVGAGTEKVPQKSLALENPPDPRHAFVDALRSALPAELVQPLALIEVKGAPLGATVCIDGKPVGTAPLEQPVVVPAGKHTVEARREEPGAAACTTTVDAPAGRTAVALLAVPPPPAPSALSRAALPGGLTLGALALGGAFLGLGAHQNGVRDSQCTSYGGTIASGICHVPAAHASDAPAKLASIDSTGRLYNYGAIGGFAAAAGLGVWTVLSLVSPPPSSRPPASSDGDLGFAPILGPATGFALGGRF